MRILVAEDDLTTRKMLQNILVKWGYEVIDVSDGAEALNVLTGKDAPSLVILDWEMPVMDGLEVLRHIRAREPEKPIYIIMLTSRSIKGDIISVLEGGADDYLVKPYDKGELRARIKVGHRTVQMQLRLTRLVKELQDSLEHIKTLQGILPLCSHCKKVRDDTGYWNQIDAYIDEHSEADISHSICPECAEKYYPDLDLYDD